MIMRGYVLLRNGYKKYEAAEKVERDMYLRGQWDPYGDPNQATSKAAKKLKFNLNSQNPKKRPNQEIIRLV